MSKDELTEPVVRIRGLPFSAREEDVVEFFKDVQLEDGKKSVTFTFGRDGRATGEAYVVCRSLEDAHKALSHHQEHMGKRYLEVFPSTYKEFTYVTGRGVASTDDFVVRLRGLPFDVDKTEIMTFFDGLEIAPNGIGLLLDNMGRSTGEAFVQFTSQEMLDKARANHMQKIGHRYIEIFKSNMIEANNSIRRQIEINEGYSEGYSAYPRPRGGGYAGRSTPYQRPQPQAGGRPTGPVKSAFGSFNRYAEGGHMSGRGPGEDWNSSTGYSIHMRGLPYSVVDTDIYEFFAPLIPVHVEIHAHPVTGRLTGEADVDFASYDEAKEAMKKDKERIGQRYIELFLNNSQSMAVANRDPGYDSRAYSIGAPPVPGSMGPRMPANPAMPARRYPSPPPFSAVRHPAAPQQAPQHYAYGTMTGAAPTAYPSYPGEDLSGVGAYVDPNSYTTDPNARAYSMHPPQRQMYDAYAAPMRGRYGGPY